MSDESEEKTLPATARKLRKAREKGQVVTSREAVMSLVGIASLVYLYALQRPIGEKLMALWILEPVGEQGFATAFESKLVIVGQLGLQLVAPLMGLVIAVSVLAGMLVSGGPVFSTHSLLPTFDKVSPASGFKRIFARRAMMGFLMHLIRLVALSAVFGLILTGAWGAMMLAPVCGLGCAGEALQGAVLPMVIGGVAVMAVMAGFDNLVQRSEFLREQKMTTSEFKREMKDMQGDPHIKGQMRSDRKRMLTSPTGPAQATLVLRGAGGLCVGVRYVEGETPAPLVVAKARGPDAARRLVAAANAPQEREDALAAAIGEIPVGGYVTAEEWVMRLAPLLHRAGIAG